MIRPFTLICMVVAGGSGLYLYQSKHQAQVLDREIARTVKQTEASRERIGMLRAEWALLNEPDRLAELARAHTGLQTLKPAQFVAMNDLAARLPAVIVPGQAAPEPETDHGPVVAHTTPAPTPPAQAVSVAEPKPDSRPVVAAVDPKPARRAAPKAPSVQTVQAPAAPAEFVTAAVPAPPRHARPAVTASAVSDAVAPGTVGAAVLRAMRTQNAAPAYVQPAAAPTPSYAPSYAPVTAAPAYAASSASVLGGARSLLPPPVPYAAR